MKQLLIATQNRGKFAEFYSILKDLPFQLVTPNDIDQKVLQNLLIKETGKTFKKNAIFKAKTYGQTSGLLTLVDDSGLCVDFLNGKPGAASHRYATGSDEDRYKKLLKEMINVPDEKRKAKFVSVIALFDPKTGKVKTTYGECKGKIAFEPRGSHGFGFDPVFIIDGLNKHFAELTLEEKNQISHRAEALRKMREILLKYT